jgi:hypothetical protein
LRPGASVAKGCAWVIWSRAISVIRAWDRLGVAGGAVPSSFVDRKRLLGARQDGGSAKEGDFCRRSCRQRWGLTGT